MLLRKTARIVLMPAILVLASFIHAGCSSDRDVKHDSAVTTPTATSQPTPQPTPNPDEAAGLITRFYRDVDAGTKKSIGDLAMIVSRDFFRAHNDDIVADYGFIKNPKVQIRDVRGRTVNYALDYVYITQGNGKLFWERIGHWALNHGTRSGWVLDSDSWDSVHLVAISTPDHPDVESVQDKVYGDGRHEFSYRGQAYSFLAKGDSWHITALTTPSPTPTADSGNGSTEAASGEGDQAAPAAYAAAAPPVVSADCESVGVEDVYDDGKILALDDGRHLSVADYDTAVSSVWVAPFDGLICSGDRFIDKDDNEAVDLAY
jgi:hypothetical protein